MKILFVAFMLLIPFVAVVDAQSAEDVQPASVATVTIECEMYFKAGKQPQILDCEIVGLEPHQQSSGE